MWAMDNGAYGDFDAAAFMRMLHRFYGRKGCRFVTAPDVVGDAAATLERWPFWSAVIRGAGFVPALVAQDGMLASELPWPEIGALFIGGFTEWKLGAQARDLIAYARARGLWSHVGRVNSESRVDTIFKMGAQSFDGSGFNIAPDVNVPKGEVWIERAAAKASLFQ